MLIRADMCVTLDVPPGTTIEDDGTIKLPDGLHLFLEPVGQRVRMESLEPVGDQIREGDDLIDNIYWRTPHEVERSYMGEEG